MGSFNSTPSSLSHVQTRLGEAFRIFRHLRINVNRLIILKDRLQVKEAINPSFDICEQDIDFEELDNILVEYKDEERIENIQKEQKRFK